MLKTIETPGDTKWFVNDRFGMFIHWGLYALPARHEWVQNKERIPNEVYDAKYFKRFDPDLYDPDLWASLAAEAGMKYFVVTTKHHEGFCMWDSKLTDFKAPNTPAGRDLLRPMVDAFRKKGLRTGFYHSLLDWHHPDYFLDPHIGPYRDHPEREKMNQGRDQARYAKYLHGQVRELLTKFGQVDVLWFDFSYPKKGTGKCHKDWESEKLYKMIRKLMPKVVLNDRLDMNYGWDIKTPEQYQPQEWVKVDGQPVVWEACQTLSGSWGYHREESTWRSADDLVRTLVDSVSKGGNLLLNVGPTGRGEIDERAVDRLRGIGAWMRYHSRAIYGCTQAPAEIKCPPDCRLTYSPAKKRLYLHLFAWPYKHVRLAGLDPERVEYAQLLHDTSEVPFTVTGWNADQIIGECSPRPVFITLPQPKPNVSVPVVEIFLK